MLNILTIARREYKGFFISPIAYVRTILFLAILGILFYLNLVGASYYMQAPGIDIIIGPMVSLFLFTTPAVTMRSLADEQRMGTLELLLTAPVRDWEVVVGKWLGAFLFELSLMALTWIFPLALNQLVTPGIDQGMLITGYLGLILLDATFLAIGVFASSLFGNQIAAFLTTMGIVLIFWIINDPAAFTGGSGNEILKYLNMSDHFYNSFWKGIIELKDVTYYVSATALALFMGSVAIETRRWR